MRKKRCALLWGVPLCLLLTAYSKSLSAQSQQAASPVPPKAATATGISHLQYYQSRSQATGVRQFNGAAPAARKDSGQTTRQGLRAVPDSITRKRNPFVDSATVILPYRPSK